MKNILSPSILAADFADLGRQIRQTQENGAEYLHFDVMDGMFVPSISFGMPVLESVRKVTDQVLDVHLMVEEPIRYIDTFRKKGADIITVHLEACKDVKATLEAIHAGGAGCGIAISPDTPVESVRPWLPEVDMVLVMSVYPGFGGQKFIPETLDRVRRVRKMIAETGREIDVQVDGGVYIKNVEEILQAGVNVIVAGSAVFGGDPAKNTVDFMEILKRNE